MPESLFDEVESHEACNFIKKRLQHSCLPRNTEKFLRTTILKNICERCFWQFKMRWLVGVRLHITEMKSHPRMKLVPGYRSASIFVQYHFILRPMKWYCVLWFHISHLLKRGTTWNQLKPSEITWNQPYNSIFYLKWVILRLSLS